MAPARGAGLYSGPIIDAHHHFWDPAMGRHPWLRGRANPVTDPVTGRAWLPADYMAAAEGLDIVATVHVEANWDPGDPEGEVAWIDGLARPPGIAARQVAFADLAAPDAAETLARLAARPAVAGIRQIVSWHPDPARSAVRDRHMMRDPRWRAGLSRLEPLGLAFDLLLSPWQIDDACDLIADFPAIRFAVNHCGSPFDRSSAGLAGWEAGLHRLAERPNVVLKISNLVAYDPEWTEASLSRVSLACLGAFGAGRCLLASDHPVLTAQASLRQAYDHFRQIFAHLPPEDQFALFAGNAAAFYGLACPDPAQDPA